MLDRWPLKPVKIYRKNERAGLKLATQGRWPLFRGGRYGRCDCITLHLNTESSNYKFFSKFGWNWVLENFFESLQCIFIISHLSLIAYEHGSSFEKKKPWMSLLYISWPTYMVWSGKPQGQKLPRSLINQK